MASIGRRFQNGELPAVAHEIADELQVPTKLAQGVLQRLLAAKIVTEITGDTFVPARPLEAISAHDILLAMRSSDEPALAMPKNAAATEILHEFEKIEKAEFSAASPLTLLTMVQRTQKAK